MDILMLGGTHFVGRNFVDRALERGHSVTLFNRGLSDPGAFPEVEHLIGDRDSDYSALAGRQWDIVIDPSCFFPPVAEMTCKALAGSVGLYLFVSSVSAYDLATDRESLDEDSPLAVPSSVTSRNTHVTGDYGGLKATCEAVIDEAMGGRMLALRSGFIVGPGDLTDRFTYWPRRIGEGGEVLLSGPPARGMRVIDVRDLTGWGLDMAERGATGRFNSVGDLTTLGQIFNHCKEVTTSNAEPVWVDEEFLLANGVKEWTELPLWITMPIYKGVYGVPNDRARAQGLVPRPLAKTIRDIWEWDAARPRPLYRGPIGTRYVVETLTPEREVELLRLWKLRMATVGPRR